MVIDKMRNDLIACYSPKQHAYRSLGSTISALVAIHDTITKLLDSKDTKAVQILCLDLSKVFVGLQTHSLMNHLNCEGMNHAFLEWLFSYLTGRTIQVKVKNAYLDVPLGVPHGSVLGPFSLRFYGFNTL